MITKLLKYLLPKHKFTAGDVVRLANGDEAFLVTGTFFNIELKPVIMIRDSRNKLYTAFEDMYVYDDRPTFNESY